MMGFRFVYMKCPEGMQNFALKYVCVNHSDLVYLDFMKSRTKGHSGLRKAFCLKEDK